MDARSRTGFELVAKVATAAIVVCLTQALFPVWFGKLAAKAEGFIEFGAEMTLLVLLAGLAILFLERLHRKRRHSGGAHARI
jgi:membrane protein implicated in regulation of membrane protease activity